MRRKTTFCQFQFSTGEESTSRETISARRIKGINGVTQSLQKLRIWLIRLFVVQEAGKAQLDHGYLTDLTSTAFHRVQLILVTEW